MPDNYAAVYCIAPHACTAIKSLQELEDSDTEPEPDLEIKIPTSRVKLVIGPGGSKIGEIQKKSKCRVQIKKEEAELMKGFGAAAKQQQAVPSSMAQIQQMQQDQQQQAETGAQGCRRI